MPIQKIGKMELKCSGGFVAKLKFSYIDDNGQTQITKDTGDIPLGQSKTADPGDLGVPEGAIVYIYAFVVWGTDNKAKQAFLYEKGNPLTAHYNISGTTLNNDLGMTNIS